MRKRIVNDILKSIALLYLLPTLALAGEANEIKIGQPAPTFVARTLEGKDFYLRDYCGEPRGKRHRQERNILVLSFFATWCRPCREEIPVLQELASKYREDGVLFYLVNQGQSPDTVENFLYEQVINLPVILDQFEVLAKKFAVRELPTLAVITKEGILAEYHTGYQADYQKNLTHRLDSLLGKNPPPVTKAVADTQKVKPKAKKKKKTLK